MGKTVNVVVWAATKEEGQQYQELDAQAFIQGFLAKLPDPRLTQTKGFVDIPPTVSLFREVAKDLVTGALWVSDVSASVDLDDLVNPALAIFIIGCSLTDQDEGNLFVYRKVEGEWVDQTPDEIQLGHKHCLRVQCGDDLGTVLLVQKGDPMWIYLVLYPNDALCQAWVKLKMLLYRQDGSAITSLMRSKDGPVCGHTVRIIRSIEAAVELMEGQLAAQCSEEIRRAMV